MNFLQYIIANMVFTFFFFMMVIAERWRTLGTLLLAQLPVAAAIGLLSGIPLAATLYFSTSVTISLEFLYVLYLALVKMGILNGSSNDSPPTTGGKPGSLIAELVWTFFFFVMVIHHQWVALVSVLVIQLPISALVGILIGIPLTAMIFSTGITLGALFLYVLYQALVEMDIL
jgi:hypothetical protein